MEIIHTCWNFEKIEYEVRKEESDKASVNFYLILRRSVLGSENTDLIGLTALQKLSIIAVKIFKVAFTLAFLEKTFYYERRFCEEGLYPFLCSAHRCARFFFLFFFFLHLLN